MTHKKLLTVLITVALIAAAIATSHFVSAPAGRVSAQDLPDKAKISRPADFDALAAAAPVDAAIAARTARTTADRMAQLEPRFGVPTVLWTRDRLSGTTDEMRAVAAADAELSARRIVGREAELYRLDRDGLNGLRLASLHDTGRGAIIAKFRPEIDGVEVFREELNVVMNRRLELVALTGYVTGDDLEQTSGGVFALSAADALATAVRDLSGQTVDASLLKQIETTGARDAQDRYERFTADDGELGGELGGVLGGVRMWPDPSRVKKVFFHLPGSYIPAYYVETGITKPAAENGADGIAAAPAEELAYSFVVSAVDGRILFRKDLVSEQSARTLPRKTSTLAPAAAFSYRVWADPVFFLPFDSPAGNAAHPKANAIPDRAQASFVPTNIVTLQNYPFSRNDPWLPVGATTTNGNNVDAFVNLTTPDGYGPAAAAPYDGTSSTGDFRANATGTSFLQTQTPGTAPSTAAARQAGVQQLFYDINFLHDWFYDAGFDERAGNAQTNNFGRGGIGGDAIIAQSQDFAGRNNANMLTPADGAPPRMRMYLFDGNPVRHVEVLSPSSIAGIRVAGTSTTGAQSFDFTGDLVQPNPSPGCTQESFAGTAGKIVLVDRDGGTCNAGTRLNFAQSAGAVGFVLVNSSSDPDGLVTIVSGSPSLTIPALTMTWNDATPLKSQLAAGQAVSVRMRRDAPVDRDGAIDNQIVFHEWGHYLSGRLVGNGNGLNSKLSGGLGEGWADFTSMLLTVRANDVSVATNSTWNGTYAVSTYVTSGGANNGYYFGIRRQPFSTDFARNGLTYKHIIENAPLPANVPTSFEWASSSNTEVHNVGEIWANMLWECYAALLRDTQGPNPRLTFPQAQIRMQYYLVASLRATPVTPTLLEARDALLAAAFGLDQNDAQRFAAAFAKRGAGTNAGSPDRYSENNEGATEDYTLAAKPAITNVTLDDSVRSFDSDAYLDGREIGRLRFNVRNVGLSTLTGSTVDVTSVNPLFGFPTGSSLSLPSVRPFLDEAVMSVRIEAANIGNNVEVADFGLSVTDPNNPSVVPAVPVRFVEFANVDEIPASTRMDVADARFNPNTVSGDTSLDPGGVYKWSRTSFVLPDKEWYASDPSAPADQYLVTPTVTVGNSGPFQVAFAHEFVFETFGGVNYDGGVVEMSVNGGPFVDIGASAYNGTLDDSPTGLNPIKGRPAFVGDSGGQIQTLLSQSLPPGSQVRVRFRLGSDAAAGAAGWRIRAIELRGVVETPYAALVAEIAPTAAGAAIAGRVSKSGTALANAIVYCIDETGIARTTRTNSFGYYSFQDLQTGRTYALGVNAKGSEFERRVVTLADNIGDLDFDSD